MCEPLCISKSFTVLGICNSSISNTVEESCGLEKYGITTLTKWISSLSIGSLNISRHIKKSFSEKIKKLKFQGIPKNFVYPGKNV